MATDLRRISDSTSMSLKNFLRLLKAQRGIDFYLKICLIIVGKVFGQFTDQNRPKTMISPTKSHTKIFWMVLGFWGIYHTKTVFGAALMTIVNYYVKLGMIGKMITLQFPLLWFEVTDHCGPHVRVLLFRLTADSSLYLCVF